MMTFKGLFLFFVLSFLSLVFFWTGVTAFSGSVFGAFLLLLAGGLYGWYKQFNRALALILVNTLSLALNPVSSMEVLGQSVLWFGLYPVPYCVAFGLLAAGLNRRPTSALASAT